MSKLRVLYCGKRYFTTQYQKFRTLPSFLRVSSTTQARRMLSASSTAPSSIAATVVQVQLSNYTETGHESTVSHISTEHTCPSPRCAVCPARNSAPYPNWLNSGVRSHGRKRQQRLTHVRRSYLR